MNYRTLYFFFEGIVVISHGLTKECVVPDKKINLAIMQKTEFEQSPEKHTYKE